MDRRNHCTLVIVLRDDCDSSSRFWGRSVVGAWGKGESRDERKLNGELFLVSSMNLSKISGSTCS